MNSKDLYNSFHEVDDDILERSEVVFDKANSKRPPRWTRFATIAACIIIIVGTLLTAEAAGGSVSNLLAPLFGFAQTEIVDEIGIPIGVTDSVDGYTLTADAVIGDRYNVAVVYTLKREDGQPITDELYFNDWETNMIAGSGSGSLTWIVDEEHPDQISFIESWSCSTPLFGRYVAASFSNLSIRHEGSEDSTVIAEGPWKLNYTLRYKDSTISVPVKKLKVTDKAGKNYQVNKILLSTIGLHIQGIYFNPVWEEENPLQYFKVSIRKKNGTIIDIQNSNKGYSFAQNDTSADIQFEAMFPEPIPMNDIEAVIICGTEVPVE